VDRQLEDGSYSFNGSQHYSKALQEDLLAYHTGKKDIRTDQVKKWKAHLNINSSAHYDQTYMPVVSWTSIQVVFATATTFKWYTIQMDYILIYVQASIKKRALCADPSGGSRSIKEYTPRQRLRQATSQLCLVQASQQETEK
jgi:hypothetical protein